MRKLLIPVSFLILANISAFAQFNSGSTGADGALDTDTLNCPTNVCYVQLPESGVLNYTDVQVRAGKTLRFNANFRNTPVVLLATGNVNIVGTLDVSGIGGQYSSVPGPGGYYGGVAAGSKGSGPGGGQVGGHGKWVGPLSLVPIVGGSGGDYPGGGGGGGLVIASSSSIFVQAGGSISANGSNPFYGTTGSGGAVRLVANSLIIAGTIEAHESRQFSFPAASKGIIRLEGQPGQTIFTGTTDPLAIFGPVNPVIVPVNPPTLWIASIAGYPVPLYSAGLPNMVDLVLPAQLVDPIQVQIQSSNVPSGTEVQLVTTTGTATGCTLTGGPGPVACNGSINLINRGVISTIIAVAVFTPSSSLAKFNPKGPNQVAKIKLETAIGAKPKYTFLRKNGKTIDSKNLSAKFLKEFGM